MNRQSRIWLGVSTAALAVGLLPSRAWAHGKSDPSGTWKWTFTTQDGQTRESTLKLKLDGPKLSGTVTGRDDNRGCELQRRRTQRPDIRMRSCPISSLCRSNALMDSTVR